MAYVRKEQMLTKYVKMSRKLADQGEELADKMGYTTLSTIIRVALAEFIERNKEYLEEK